ncbi:MAG: hypothetical protein ACFB0G_11100 [Leptolyngbyaceae cyanobacterium]
MAKKITQEWLDERLEFWQKILRLGDWKITAQIVPQSELDEGVAGNLHHDQHMRKGEIRIMRPEDLPQLRTKLFEADVEHTLVHELLHIHLLSAEFQLEKQEEFAINAIADALMALGGD